MTNINSAACVQLTQLIIKRETFRKEAQISDEEYTRKFGELIYEIYLKKMNCLFLKKKIGQCVLCKNRNQSIVREQIEKYFDDEMKDYQTRLEQWLTYYDSCKMPEYSNEKEVLEAKAVFRRIVKLIHPDIIGRLADDAEFHELWHKTLLAYGRNDVSELEALEVLSLDALRKKGIDVEGLEIPYPKLSIDIIKRDIQNIIESEPYIFREILMDQSLCDEKDQSLKEELETYVAYENELEDTLNSYYEEGDNQWKIKIYS